MNDELIERMNNRIRKIRRFAESLQLKKDAALDTIARVSLDELDFYLSGIPEDVRHQKSVVKTAKEKLLASTISYIYWTHDDILAKTVCEKFKITMGELHDLLIPQLWPCNTCGKEFPFKSRELIRKIEKQGAWSCQKCYDAWWKAKQEREKHIKMYPKP